MTKEVEQETIDPIQESIDALNEKQVSFCREYIIDLNATQAYIRVGYAEESADSNSHRFMGNEGIQALIARLQQERASRQQLSADYALSKLRKNLEAAERAGKYADVNKAVETLLKHFGELTEKTENKTEHTGSVAVMVPNKVDMPDSVGNRE